MEGRLHQRRNLMEQLELEGGGLHTANHPEYVEEVVLGDGGGEAAIKNHHHRLPNHLYEAYAVVVSSHFQDQDHPCQAATSGITLAQNSS